MVDHPPLVAGAVFNITNCIIGAGTIGLQWLP
jgi:hypothetical protein